MTPRLNYEAAAPGGVKALGGVYGYVRQSGLDPVLVDLVYMRVSQINGCAYCIALHHGDLIKHGIPAARIAMLPVWHEVPDLFDPRERAALAWAETVTRVSDTHVPDDAFAAAASVFSEKELADLTIAIGLMNAYNRMAIAFRRTPDVAH